MKVFECSSMYEPVFALSEEDVDREGLIADEDEDDRCKLCSPTRINVGKCLRD
jgi:hypothetical protein